MIFERANAKIDGTIELANLSTEKRAYLQKLQESMLSSTTPITYDHPATQSLLSEFRVVLRPVTIKKLSLQFILSQATGVFLVEFYWRINRDMLKKKCKVTASTSNWHVMVVNCDWRLIFCNTLGIIPFSDVYSKESEHSHETVAKRFHINFIHKVWVMFRARVSAPHT